MRLLFILLFSYSTGFCQPSDSITIEFENIDLLEEGWQGRQFYFKINNQVFLPNSKPINIALSSTRKPSNFSIENFYFSFDNSFTHAKPAMACFFYDSTYIVRINPCSQYELYPKYQRKQGTITVADMGFEETDTVYLEANGDIIDTIYQGYKQKVIQLDRSQMCQFAPVRISSFIYDQKSRKRKELHSEYIHFLHGEKFRLIYHLTAVKSMAFVGLNK